jgi:hypothetical protein
MIASFSIIIAKQQAAAAGKRLLMLLGNQQFANLESIEINAKWGSSDDTHDHHRQQQQHEEQDDDGNGGGAIIKFQITTSRRNDNDGLLEKYKVEVDVRAIEPHQVGCLVFTLKTVNRELNKCLEPIAVSFARGSINSKVIVRFTDSEDKNEDEEEKKKLYLSESFGKNCYF